jgi:3-oxoadipate enol-lactonase
LRVPYAAINDIDLYYESHGSGPAILFAHGVGGNHLSWWQQIPVFARRFHCITIDHRAFGRSRDLEDGPGRVQFSPDAVALMDSLGIDKFYVVAQSMGGRTASGLIYRFPERLLGVIYCGSTGGSVDAVSRELQRVHREALPPEQSQLDRALAPGYGARQPAMEFLYREIRRLNPPRPADFLAPRPGWTGGSFSQVLVNSGVPIQFMAGEFDAITPAHIVERAALLAQARFVRIPNSGHSAYFEKPEAFNAAVLAFIDELEAKRHA